MESLFQDRSEILSTHDLRLDPTHGLSSVYRETCVVCGASALQMSSGPVYGRATGYTCGEVVAIESAVTHA